MTDRASFTELYLAMAGMFSRRSTCKRLSVGCVITSTDHRYVYGIGYNGNASGMNNGCDSEEPGKCGCLHAEENAVINCTTQRDVPKNVYCTNLPCKMCAKRLVNLGGVQAVYYLEGYRLTDGLDVLDTVGIRHEQVGVGSDDDDQH